MQCPANCKANVQFEARVHGREELSLSSQVGVSGEIVDLVRLMKVDNADINCGWWLQEFDVWELVACQVTAILVSESSPIHCRLQCPAYVSLP